MLQPEAKKYVLRKDWLGHQRGTGLYLYPHYANTLIAHGIISDSREEIKQKEIKKKGGRPKGSKNKRKKQNNNRRLK